MSKFTLTSCQGLPPPAGFARAAANAADGGWTRSLEREPSLDGIVRPRSLPSCPWLKALLLFMSSPLLNGLVPSWRNGEAGGVPALCPRPREASDRRPREVSDRRQSRRGIEGIGGGGTKALSGGSQRALGVRGVLGVLARTGDDVAGGSTSAVGRWRDGEEGRAGEAARTRPWLEPATGGATEAGNGLSFGMDSLACGASCRDGLQCGQSGQYCSAAPLWL